MVTRVQQWKKDFGSIVYLSALGKPLVVLNDMKSVIELFEKRGAMYSHRPHFLMIGELCGFDRLPAIASDSPRLRGLRKLLNSEIGPKKAYQYQETMEAEVVTYLAKLLQAPADFLTHIRWYSTDIIMLISYGYRVALKDDVHMELSNRVMYRLVRDSQPGAWLVDLIPIIRRELEEWVTTPWQLVKSQTITTPSFASRMMEQYPDFTPEEEDLIIWSAASIYSAGADTSVSSITTFFLAITLHPAVQKTAQAEIDSVIGSDQRLPGFSDQGSLPYVCALVLEIFRWGSTLPLGAPRRLNQNDVFEGFEIPKDSTIMANVWGILHDSEVYPNPREFDPTRFMGEHPQPDPRDVVFGFGRRLVYVHYPQK
jgi:cytochrome P450